MNYAGKFGSGDLDPFPGADIGFGPLLSPHGHLSSPGKFHVDKVSTHAPSDAIIISDAHLLFHGDFKRSGVDLVLSSGDRELVLPDYFRGEKRAALASPDGAHLTGDIVNALTGHTQFAQADGSASVAPQLIGHVTKLTGSATAIRNGVSIILNQGDTVHKGDVVQSGSDSTLGMTFIDGTVFGLASNAKMVLNEMVYDPNGSDNKSLLSLVAGTISFVAGATAKKGDMKVDTPVATMGIRGTAVLVEIDFEVPSQGGAPPAKFQVLVEPDGTTGSYILFDKTTLTPIATVNRAGTQTIINGQGTVSFQSSVQLSPDAQKIISDVFSLKFTDLNNPNTKLTSNFTDSIVPENSFLKLASNDFVPVTLQFVNVPDRPAAGPSTGPGPQLTHIPGPPAAAASGSSFTERTAITASAAVDSMSGKVGYADINPGDVPSVKTEFSSFTYANAQNADVTATLTAEQLAAIKAVEVPLSVVQDPNGKNTGQATWTYNIADGAFDFLASGETLTLTYMARVDNNYAPSNETTFVPFKIVITGTNDKPTISATGGEITERIGTGNTAVDIVTGTVTFADVDLTDRPVVSAAISATDPFRYYDAEGNDVTVTLTPSQRAAILAVEVPLSVAQAAGNTHNGSATWTYSVEDSKFDFIAKGETLTLNYVAQVDDGHGGVVSTPITVSIQGADVVVIGTNDVPTIAATSDAFAEFSNVNQPNPTGSDAFHVASGTISFTDVDLTDRPVASATFTSFSYLNAYSVDVTSQLTAKQLAAIAAVDGPLTVVQAPGNTNNGSATWSYSTGDNAFDFLAVGETLTLTYTATVDDGHGGVVTKPITITVTGSNDTPEITSATQAATIAERADAHGSATPDTASGAIAFSDVDLTDTHEVDITSVHASGVTTGLANGTVQLSWLSLGSLHDSTDGAQGSQSWSFSAPDSYFDYLADGQSVTLTYTVEVDDHHGGVTAQDIVVTVNGSNDAPEIANIAQQALTEQTDTTPLTTTIPVTFTDRDLSDVGHSATITHAAATGTTTGLALDEAALIALVAPGAVTKAAGSTAGAVNLSFSAASTAFDYLAKGEVLTLTYTVSIDDGDGGVTPQTFIVTVTGTNDAPSIVGEVDPSAQTVIVVAPTGPVVLAPGVSVNSLGLNTETFDGVAAGATSNNGAGSGNFESAALGAHFSASGNSGIVVGSSSVTAAPFVGPLPGARDTTHYLSIGSNSTETITFASEKNTFGLYWGSLDSYNTIKFYDGTTLVASYTGNDILPLFPTGNQGSFASNGYVEFSGLHSFNKVVLGSSSNAFEIDNISAGNIPSPGLSGPIKGTLNVHDADIGDALTAFVIGNATIEYNGSSSVPGNIDISTLVNAADVTFDTASSNGGTVVLNWTYQPINANLDFLNAGDILKIKFVAEVSDGHGHTGSQPLTITLVGAENTTNASLSLATGPVIDTDAVSVTENGDGTTTVSGLHVSDGDATAPNDTFTVSAVASSTSGSVIPPAADGSLSAVNTTLNSGINYDPGDSPPQTDMVTLTVSDGLGHSDTVHFVFNEAGQGPVALVGTSGKDVIFATGSDDTLTGGASADQFVFAPGQNPSADTITDFTPGQDRIDLRLFSEVGSDNINSWLSTHAIQSSTNPADILITLGNEALTLKNVTVTSLHAGDFIVSPHHVI
ncbi:MULTISPECIES: VCBS domain-containing protein [unclassified Bradyrhizobium]|uniref:VCBS domain-containing protein n=1 Tax=unclassified Bradyrhizobium TaxID=2631580 RepID=UPI002FF22E29